MRDLAGLRAEAGANAVGIAGDVEDDDSRLEDGAELPVRVSGRGKKEMRDGADDERLPGLARGSLGVKRRD